MEQKRGEDKQRFFIKKGGGQAGPKGGCLKKGGLEPSYELCIILNVFMLFTASFGKILQSTKIMRSIIRRFGTELQGSINKQYLNTCSQKTQYTQMQRQRSLLDAIIIYFENLSVRNESGSFSLLFC